MIGSFVRDRGVAGRLRDDGYAIPSTSVTGGETTCKPTSLAMTTTL
jgi:hypothetical protein